MKAFRFKPLLTICVLPCIAILISLGVWQVQRLAWKTELIEMGEAGLRKPASIFDPSQPLPDQVSPVVLTGTLYPEKSVNLRGYSIKGVTGDHRVSLLKLTTGEMMAVSRGWVSKGWQDGDLSPQPFEEEVVMRNIRQVRGGDATGYNNPEMNIWLYAVPDQLAQHWGVETLIPRLAEVLGPKNVVESMSLGPLPIKHERKVNLPNNHLGYALTWFGLAFALLFIYGVMSLKRKD